MNTKCFNNCDAPVVNTIEGQPVCAACLDHYMGYDKPAQEYGDGMAYAAATGRLGDLR